MEKSIGPWLWHKYEFRSNATGEVAEHLSLSGSDDAYRFPDNFFLPDFPLELLMPPAAACEHAAEPTPPAPISMSSAVAGGGELTLDFLRDGDLSLACLEDFVGSETLAVFIVAPEPDAVNISLELELVPVPAK